MSFVEFDRQPSWSLDTSETVQNAHDGRGSGVNSIVAGRVGKNLCSTCRAFHHPYPWAFCTLPSFACVKDQDGDPQTRQSTSMISQKKIGHCEQSTKWKKFVLIGQLAYKHRSIFSFCFTPVKYTDFLLAVHETKTVNLSIFTGYVSVRHSFRALRHHCCMFFVMGAQMPVHGGLKGCS